MVVVALALALALDPGRARADDQWLWAGHSIDPTTVSEQTLYIFQGHVRAAGPSITVERQGLFPHQTNARGVWLVYRLATLQSPDAFASHAVSQLRRWETAGNSVAGLQLDFDAPTAKLKVYQSYVHDVRAALPPAYQLGVTGLLDWAANADPAALAALGRDADEVVFQMYRGTRPVKDLDQYVAAIAKLSVPFRIGLLASMREGFAELTEVRANPRFRGVVIFPLPPRSRGPAT